MYTQLKCTVRVLLRGTVQIRTAGVRNYRSLQIAVYGVLHCRERSRTHTPGAQCTTGPPKCTVRVLLRRTVQLHTAGVRKYRSLQITVHGVLNSRVRSPSRTTGLKCATVSPRYNVYTHSISALFGSYCGELYRSVQQVYENTARCR